MNLSDRIRKSRILVIGDAMLDTYIYGEVSRISPEAPIPVICPNGQEDRSGGAANVACNAAALGAKVTALFLIGNDSQASRLLDKLLSFGVDTGSVIQADGQNTINKVRLMGNGQQIARIDLNDRYTLDHDMEDELLKRFREIVSEQEVVILSDYGKGTCTEKVCQQVIRMSNAAGKPVIVDPKGTDWEKYRGAFVITPNMKELNRFAGKSVPNEDAAIEGAYQCFCRQLGIRYLLLTRSEQGMSLLDDHTTLHIPTQAQEVNDVSGAGDTAVSALAVKLAEKPENIRAAVRFANAAAGVVVGKPGTAVVTKEEVLAFLEELHQESEQPGIYTMSNMDALEQTIRCWREKGDTIVTTNGCFDLFHIGHLRLLQEARLQGSRLVVAINADAAVRRLKGSRRPINNEMDRAEILLSMRMVDAVVIFDPEKQPDVLTEEERAKLSDKALTTAPEAPMALMRRIHPDVHVKGGDYDAKDLPEGIFAKRVVVVPFVEGYSTTATLERVK